MGARPSVPTGVQQEELERRKPEIARRAALAIQQADILLVATGAGWSADSGLAIYRDVADVAAYHERDLTYRDICQPHWIEQDPALFYGFWGGCFNDYRSVTPHEGYSIIQKWVERSFRHSEAARTVRRHLAVADRLRNEPQRLVGYSDDDSNDALAILPPNGDASEPYAGAFFSYTSNVDAHWITSGICAEHECHEIHGNCETWQCTSSACQTGGEPAAAETTTAAAAETAEVAAVAAVAEADSGAVAPMDSEPTSPPPPFGGRWRAPPGYRFRVDETSRLAEEGPPQETANAPAGTRQPRDGEAFASNWPKCVTCGSLARPAVLMFGDSGYVDDRASGERFEEWREAVSALALKHAWKVAILEVGCGGNVTTVRMQTEEVLEELVHSGVDACLVRVNPELPLADASQNEHHVLPLLSRGLAALQQIDALMAPPTPAAVTEEFSSPFEGFELGGLRRRPSPQTENDEASDDGEAAEDGEEGASAEPRVYSTLGVGEDGDDEDLGGEVDVFDSTRNGNRVTGGRRGRGNGGVLESVRASVETDDEAAKDKLEALKRMLRGVDDTISRSSAAHVTAESSGAGEASGGSGIALGAWERFAANATRQMAGGGSMQAANTTTSSVAGATTMPTSELIEEID